MSFRVNALSRNFSLGAVKKPIYPIGAQLLGSKLFPDFSVVPLKDQIYLLQRVLLSL
jgi:hypothetical protein